MKPVKKVLEDADLKIKDIDEIVLVGGSTRIPKIQQLVKEEFGGKVSIEKVLISIVVTHLYHRLRKETLEFPKPEKGVLSFYFLRAWLCLSAGYRSQFFFYLGT